MPPLVLGHVLTWTPTEKLEQDLAGGLEERLPIWRGRRVGAVVHSEHNRRTVLLGPVDDLLGSPIARWTIWTPGRCWTA